ncbi:MAG: TatD family hydrolase, partial [Gemmatimonadota bacterium]
ALDLARVEEDVWCTAGLHPHAAGAFGEEVMEALETLLGEPEVVAVGETGLDYHYDNAPRDAQRRSFEAHMELADGRGLPVVVHTREADADTARILERLGAGVTGVLHCYTAGVELLETGVALGWYVSFSGIATFRGFDAAPLVRRVPDDRLLIETDSPYLAPTPKRGRRNEPAFLPHTCAAVAELRGERPEETAALTRANARRLYGLES